MRVLLLGIIYHPFGALPHVDGTNASREEDTFGNEGGEDGAEEERRSSVAMPKEEDGVGLVTPSFLDKCWSSSRTGVEAAVKEMSSGEDGDAFPAPGESIEEDRGQTLQKSMVRARKCRAVLLSIVISLFWWYFPLH